MKFEEFRETFCSLTALPAPFPWQETLFGEFTKGNFPSLVLPTGMGKTTVIGLWLIALAYFPENVPRRMAYVVNRRTVVDQTTEEVERYRERLEDAHSGSPLGILRSKLTALCALPLDDKSPLAISTLRGQRAESREWSCDPCRPAVIAGTVDLIGSRLLFRGYRSGFRSKPLYAGFLGQDTLLVHDESHLEPAFQALLNALVNEQKKSPDQTKGIKVMELSATIRTGSQSSPLTLSKEDEDNVEVAKRFKANKTLSLIPTDGKTAEAVIKQALAFANSGRAVLVFLRTVDDVEKVVKELTAKKQVCEVLTGTMRGKERDELVSKPHFQRFLSKNAPSDEGTVYLISTSAGEVGVNLSADDLVCDLSTFESMAQRFGRVNRFGSRDDSSIHVIHPISFDPKDEVERRRKLTLNLLIQLDGDASPFALSRLDPEQRSEAFAPEPLILPPVTNIIYDSWSLTSITEKLTGRPEVAPYLHGIDEAEPPQTAIAWRTEVEKKLEAILDKYSPEKLLELFPLKPHEILKDRSDRVFKRLESLAEDHPETGVLPVWLFDEETEKVEVRILKDIVSERGRDLIEGRTLILPPSMGGLSQQGLLDSASTIADDVSEIKDRRVRCWDVGMPNMRLIAKIDTAPDPELEEAKDEDTEPKPRFWNWYEAPKSGDTDGSRSAPEDVVLEDHAKDVRDNMSLICQKLGCPDDLTGALVLAAECHDLGKDRAIWQKSVGNFDPNVRLAKSKARMRAEDLDSYRHEFGSLLDISRRSDFQALTPELRDVTLHLIACHHGRARPHFNAAETFDPEGAGLEASEIAQEIPRRFARLQRRYGRWGLAYLESLLRAADYAASSKSSPRSENK